MNECVGSLNGVNVAVPDALLEAVVAIPVRNERERIAACLEALSAQVDLPNGSLGILLFLNNCDDGTELVVEALEGCIPWPVRVIRRFDDKATAGWARRAAMDAAADWLLASGADDGTILTTDADSRVGPTWVRRNLDAIGRGADAVAGRFVLDPAEAALLPAFLHKRGRLEARYEALLTEIEARLDPVPGDPWPCHWTASGATLAVRRSIYISVGGMPPLALGEDRAFVEALRDHGARLRHDPDIQVVTSGRLHGRARGGAADTIRMRCEDPDSLCDARLEPLVRATLRIFWRRRLRFLYAKGDLRPVRLWAARLRIRDEDAEAIVTAASSYRLLIGAVEAASPRLSPRPLHPKAIPNQILVARVLLSALRIRDRFRHAGRPADTLPFVTDAAIALSPPLSE